MHIIIIITITIAVILILRTMVHFSVVITGAALDGKNASPSITYHPRWLPLSRV